MSPILVAKVFVHSFTHSFIHSFIHLFIHSFIARKVLQQTAALATISAFRQAYNPQTRSSMHSVYHDQRQLRSATTVMIVHYDQQQPAICHIDHL